MQQQQFDVIVVGAGLAGLCCAGELVRLGRRPLLISETDEVGAVFVVTRFDDNNYAFIQHITWQLGWGGGWWYPLARALGVPLRIYPGYEFEVKIRGIDRTVPTPICVSAVGLADMICDAFPLPSATRQNLEKVLEAGLMIPYQELMEMSNIPMGEWLAQQGADELASKVILALCGQMNDLTVDLSSRYQSVLGGIGLLRILFCGEGVLANIAPNIREGLCVPLARAIEQRGGTVWRGTKVAEILIEDGRAVGVLMEDGRIARSNNVGVAVGNPRIPAILKPLPEEIREPIKHSANIDMQDFNLWYLLNKPVVQPPRDRRASGTFDPQTFSVTQVNLVLSGVSPWAVEPGKQIVLGHTALPLDEIEKVGGREAIYERILALSEEHYPGLTGAIEKVVRKEYKNRWFNSICIGPKIPRIINAVQGLWFVGDGSSPSAGVWTECAASCGVLGARSINESI